MLKGEIGEINVADNIRSAFLAIPNVRIVQLGGAGDTDAIIHFELGGVEIAKVVIECKKTFNLYTRSDGRHYTIPKRRKS